MSLANKILAGIFFLFTSFTLTGQTDIDLENRMVWYYGEVTFTNEKTAQGLLNYSLITGVLTLKSENGLESLSSQQISRFTLTDSVATKNFYSIPVLSDRHNREKWVFMESVYESDHLAILLKHEAKGSKYASDPYVRNLNTYDNPAISEILYLANRKGNVIRYAKKLASKGDNTLILPGDEYDFSLIGQQTAYGSDPSNRYKILRKDALQTLMVEKYSEVRAYMKEEKKKPNVLGDLIDIFEFYGNL